MDSNHHRSGRRHHPLDRRRTIRYGESVVTSAYTTQGWTELFLATANGTVALGGLIFVGLSVNLKTVLDIDKRRGGNFLTGRELDAHCLRAVR
jgi:hypothetical protein